MTKDKIFEEIFESNLMTSWHWFQWHFRHQLKNQYHPFSDAIVTAITEIDKKIPRYASKTIKTISCISGKEKYIPHYEQLLQVLAEIHVIKQLVQYKWSNLEKFEYEPKTSRCNKNPELLISYNGIEIGVEVKAPSLVYHINQRLTNPTQFVSRVLNKSHLEDISNVLGKITPPRDNPIKDFLVSANKKFEHFKYSRDNFYGVLVIVWDDFIYEPITALIHPNGGLFSDKSFFTDNNGISIKFPFVDAVIVIPHLHQLMKASRDEPLIDNCKNAFDYGIDGEFPQKVFIKNPFLSNGVPEEILMALQAYTPTYGLGAEYHSSDIILWLKIGRNAIR